MSDKWIKPDAAEADEMRDAMHEQVDKQTENEAFRREGERVRLEAQVTVTSETNFFTGLSENLSEGGIFISSLAPPDLGTVVETSIATDGGPPINVTAEVMWVRTDDGQPVGCGCRFLNLDEVTAARLKDFISRAGREPLFYDV